MASVFTLAENNSELVVVRVKKASALTYAKNPWIDSGMAYITITKGNNHILKIINRDGTSRMSIEWGYNGHTIISGSTQMLKNKVLDFLNSVGVFDISRV